MGHSGIAGDGNTGKRSWESLGMAPWERLLPGGNGGNFGIAGDGNGSFPAGMGGILGSLGMGMAPSWREWGEFWGRWEWEWLLPGGNGGNFGVAGDGNGSFPVGMGGILGSLGMGMAPSRREWEGFWDRWGWEWLLPGGNGGNFGITGDGNGSFLAGMGGILGSLELGIQGKGAGNLWEWLLGNGSFLAGMGGILGSLGMGMAPSRWEWEGFWDRWGWEWLLPGGNGRDSGIAGDGNGSFPAGMGGILGSLGMGMAPSRREWEGFWDRWGWEWLLPGGNGRDFGITGDGNGSFLAGMGGILGSLELGMQGKGAGNLWEWLVGNGSFLAGMGGILGSLGMGMAPSRWEWEGFWDRWGWEWLLPGGNGRDSGIAGDGNGSFPAGMGGILGSLGMGMAPSRREWEGFWDRWGWEWLRPGGNGGNFGVAGNGNGSFPVGMGGILGSLELGMQGKGAGNHWEWLLGNGSFLVGMGGILGSLEMGMQGKGAGNCWKWLFGNGLFPAGRGGILGSLELGNAGKRSWESLGMAPWEWLLLGRNGRDSGITGDGES
ncbi:uncharacterized protein LOC116436420 isoform X2 [Corvus moneduloides]|uniref:uncharacterized protein LOC116436420 isoform X2 n=1 Tax=Corvus moneduloides TaxID=1196302 RepID=UPI001363E2DA|nr:uncharacterized protein LOC116436420 isoform X2 [Corvus moneduloides]